MSDDENYRPFFRKVRDKGKSLPGFDEFVTVLGNQANSRGLEDEDLDLILSVVKKAELGAMKKVSLIKCMIPHCKISDSLLNEVILWFIQSSNKLAISITIIILQWIIGILEYNLGDRETVNVFYEVFFYHMLNNRKLEPYLARIIYELTKPDDVTRSQVIRLQSLQKNHTRPQKHLTALLSLFKSYKPELVPENIPSIGVGTAWKSIPNNLRIDLENANSRASVQENRQRNTENFKWCTTRGSSKRNSKEPILPSVEYFHIGSSIFKEENTRSIFDVTNFESLGKYHKDLELPANATSLLSSTAGYHLLMFADFQYQNRFSYNLYNSLRRAFLLEPGKYEKHELDMLLDLTYNFLHYLQHGIPIVSRFLDEYLSCRTGEHQAKLLALAEWTPLSITAKELEDCVLKHMKLMFFESSVEEKCEIIRTLRMMLFNLCVNCHFATTNQNSESSFLGQKCTINLEEMLPVITNFTKSLIVSGFNNHSNSLIFISEALHFYEQIFITETKYKINSWTFAPSAIIYGGFLSKSCVILSRVCSLLIDYRGRSKYFMQLDIQNHFSQELYDLETYASDLANALWHGQAFSNRFKRDGKLFKTLSVKAIDKFSIDTLDKMLCLNHHYAILPYKYVLVELGLSLTTKEDFFKVALQFFPDVSEFLRIMVGFEVIEDEEL